MAQVKAALLTPITAEEVALYANAGELPYDQIIFDGAFDEVQEFCLANGWTDENLPAPPITNTTKRRNTDNDHSGFLQR